MISGVAPSSMYIVNIVAQGNSTTMTVELNTACPEVIKSFSAFFVVVKTIIDRNPGHQQSILRHASSIIKWRV